MLCLTIFVYLYSRKYFLKILNGDSWNSEFNAELKELTNLLFVIKMYLKCLDFMEHWTYFFTGIKREISHVLLLIELKCQYTSSPTLEFALWLDCSNANYLCLHLAVNTVLHAEHGAECSMARMTLTVCGESAEHPSNVTYMDPKEKIIWGSAILTLGSVQLSL